MTKITTLLKHGTQHIVHDRPYLFLMASVFGVGMLYVLYVLFSVHSTDIQVITRYSGVGETHFYKAKWHSLYGFALFGLIMTVIHLTIMAKLHEMEHRDVGVVFGWIALTIALVGFSYTFGVMRLAFL